MSDPPQIRKTTGNYTYDRISDLGHKNTSNFYGIIVKCSEVITPPETTKDKSCRMEVIDDPDNKINVNVFFSKQQFQPLPPGTIVRFHRAKITKSYQSLLATGNLDNSQSRFTMVWVMGDKGDPIKVHTRTKSYTFTENDERRVEQLRNVWAEIKHLFISDQSTATIPTAATSSNLLSINNNNNNNRIAPTRSFGANNNNNNNNNRNRTLQLAPLGDLPLHETEYVNVICKIISKSIVMAPNEKKITFNVWDGTGLGYEYRNNQTDKYLAHRLGVVMGVIAWDPMLIPAVDSLTSTNNPDDQWVLMSYVLVHRYQGNLELKINKTSNITLLDESHPNVAKIIKLHRDRIDEYLRLTHKDEGEGEEAAADDNTEEDDDNNKQTQRPQQYTGKRKPQQQHVDHHHHHNRDINRVVPIFTSTSTLHPSVPITSINDIKNDTVVPKRYKINCKFIQHLPMNILDFTRYICRQCNQCIEGLPNFVQSSRVCPSCQSSDIGSIFMFKLLVQDESGELPILVYNDSAELFFNGIKACNLYEHVDKLGFIENKMIQLKQKCSPEIGNSSFDCCIVSYYIEGQDRIPENVRYQLFDTKLN